MAKLIPLEDYIVIKTIEEEKTTKSGIILPESKEKSNKWKVISVWLWKILENWERWPIDIKIWDVVYFAKYAQDEIEVDWEKYVLVKQSSVFAKLW